MNSTDYAFTTGSEYVSNQSTAYQNAAFADYFVDLTMTTERFEIMMNGAYGHMPHLSLYMHTKEGEFIGFARTAARASRAWCAGLALVPTWRAKKVGGVLTKKYLELLNEKSDIKVLQLECINANVPAMKLYERVGFRKNYDLFIYGFEGGGDNRRGAPDGYEFRNSDALDLQLPWLQYRTQYSWQREISSVLAIKSTQLALCKITDGSLVMAIAVEERIDYHRIIAIAYTENPGSEHLSLLIREAVAASGKNKALLVNEPEHSPVISLLESVGNRETELESTHMIYEFQR